MHVWIHFVAFMKIIAEQFSSARLNWHDWESPNLLDNKDEKVCLLHTSCYVAFGKKIVSGTGSTYHITDFPLQVGIYQIQQNMIHRTVKKRNITIKLFQRNAMQIKNADLLLAYYIFTFHMKIRKRLN